MVGHNQVGVSVTSTQMVKIFYITKKSVYITNKSIGTTMRPPLNLSVAQVGIVRRPLKLMHSLFRSMNLPDLDHHQRQLSKYR